MTRYYDMQSETVFTVLKVRPNEIVTSIGTMTKQIFDRYAIVIAE